MKPVEVDFDAVIAGDVRRLIDYENTLWAEAEPGEPLIADAVVPWLHRLRPNNKRWVWIADGDDGQVAGMAVLSGSVVDNLHLANLDVRVVPAFRGRGVGRAMLELASARAVEDGRRLLAGYTWDTVPSGERFAVAAGATAVLFVRRSELDLTKVDRSLVATWAHADADEGRARYELVTVLGRYPTDQYEAIAEVEEVMNTAPHDDLEVEDEVRDAAWVAAREALYDPEIELRWTIFARELASGRFVGYTQVFFYDDWPGHVGQGNTGVHPDHRGHGLGRWLKAAMLQRIFDERPESFRVRTTNAFSNAPMLAINDELGFVVTATSTAWQLPLS